MNYAVDNSTRFIPDIFAQKKIEIIDNKDQYYTLYIYDIIAEVGDRIKITHNTDVHVSVQQVLEDKIKVYGYFSYPITTPSLFVFGKQVQDFKSINTENLIPVMWSSIQELYRKNTLLEEKVDTLKAIVDSLHPQP